MVPSSSKLQSFQNLHEMALLLAKTKTASYALASIHIQDVWTTQANRYLTLKEKILPGR